MFNLVIVFLPAAPATQAQGKPRLNPMGESKAKAPMKAKAACSGSVSRSPSPESLLRPRGMVSYSSVTHAYEGKRYLVCVSY